MTKKPVILSGVTSSGQPTLGNFIGAFLPFSRLVAAGTHNVFMMIADHHAITVRQDPKEFHENTLAIAAWYIACGNTPDKCNLFIQSHVRHHTELAWVLNTFTQMGELERMTQFKDKAQQHRENINAGLFTYPVLMAADILLYHATEVPTGDDQTQHIELTRDIATRFNNIYGPVFTIPKATPPAVGARVMDLQEPDRKMSKSRPGPGTILLAEPAADAARKIKRAVTDSIGVVKYDPINQRGLANLIDILAACTNRSAAQVATEFAGQQYGPLKNAVAEAVEATLSPIQAEYQRLMSDRAELARILEAGAAQARAVAEQTCRTVLEKVGYVLPSTRL